MLARVGTDSAASRCDSAGRPNVRQKQGPGPGRSTGPGDPASPGPPRVPPRRLTLPCCWDCPTGSGADWPACGLGGVPGVASLRDSLPSLGRLVALLHWLDHASASPFHPLASFCCFRLLFAVFSRRLCVSHSAWGLGCAWRPAQSSPRVLPIAWESSHCATPINSRRVSDTPKLLFATPAAAFLTQLRDSMRRSLGGVLLST
jgi:hypothetical protein